MLEQLSQLFEFLWGGPLFCVSSALAFILQYASNFSRLLI